MEGLARDAGVSHPLVYKYFSTRMELLQALLEHALEAFGDSVEQQLSDVSDYKEIIRIFVATNFDQFQHGSVINTLLAQPDIRAAAGDAEQRRAGTYLVRQLTRRLRIEADQAQLLVVLGAGASQAAAQRYSGSQRDRAKTIDETTRFIVGGVEQLIGQNAEPGG